MSPLNHKLSRRMMLASGAMWLAPALPQGPKSWRTGGPSYDTEVSGIRILSGQWRPHYQWEQIAWISPPWPSQDYLWLDFPEAIFSSEGLLFLSAVNPKFPALFPELPKIPWRRLANGMAFDRTLPNGVRFAGQVIRETEWRVALELTLENGNTQPLRNIALQTCLYLRAIREFSDHTNGNKYVHVPDGGWISLADALLLKETGPAPYRVGWRKEGKAVADLPVMATVSDQAERLVAMTWHHGTLSLIGNPRHPCMHADPQFKDLAPGERASIRGHIVFFEGKLRDFDWRKETEAE